MEVIWTNEADISYNENLEYWANRNQSNLYSKRIILETKKIESSIANNPYFLARYHENIGLYQRTFFKGKYSLYYKIEKNSITIIHFRSNKQKPL
jgi:hypothetical protein